MSSDNQLVIFIPMLGFGKNGGHRVLSCLATELVNLGHDVTFVCPESYHDLYFPTKAKVIYIRSLNNYLPKFFRTTISRDLLGLFALTIYLLKICQQGQVIMANRDLSAYVARSVKFFRKVKAFYYIQAYEPDFYEWRNSLKRTIAKKVSKFTYSLNLIRIVNSPIYRSYREIKAVEMVAPGYDETKFYPKKKSVITSSQISIGCIGRKQDWKGTKEIIEAVKLLSESGFNVELRVAFELPDSCLGDDSIKLLKPHGDILLAEFYRSCDIFIAIGKIQYGAFHYPCLEALACGVPLIASPYHPANSSNAKIIHSVNGNEIASAIIDLISEPEYERELRRSQGILDAKNFSWSKSGKKLEEIFFKKYVIY